VRVGPYFFLFSTTSSTQMIVYYQRKIPRNRPESQSRVTELFPDVFLSFFHFLSNIHFIYTWKSSYNTSHAPLDAERMPTPSHALNSINSSGSSDFLSSIQSLSNDKLSHCMSTALSYPTAINLLSFVMRGPGSHLYPLKF
jgi:hypothetical protein